MRKIVWNLGQEIKDMTKQGSLFITPKYGFFIKQYEWHSPRVV